MEENDNFNQKPKRSGGIFVVVFVMIMLVANVEGNLPKLKMNVLSASSFVIKNSQQTAFDAAEFFSETRNILVLGKSGGSYIAPNLTDTIFVAHIDGPTKKIKLISLPRDFAVKLPSNGGITKINALYQIGLRKSERDGLKLIQEKVEEVTGLKIDSFVMFDLASVEKIIDEI
jgi:anionic cell wall polymer biosynthesis LytR-Cps2A-Psr (LCP) family protein